MTPNEIRQIAQEMTNLKLKIDELMPGITDPSASDLCDIAISIRVKTMCLNTYFNMLHILKYDAYWCEKLKSYVIELDYPFQQIKEGEYRPLRQV